MDIRAAVIGTLLGAGACGAAWWLVDRSRPTAVCPVASNESSAPAGPEPSAVVAVPHGDIDAEAQSPKSNPQPAISEALSEDSDAEISTSNIARDKRRKEERDIEWSYRTEQAIRQYLVTNKGASKFEIILVECRASFCEIEASGYTDDAWPVWQQVVQDVTTQPWSEFGSSGSSTESRLGRPIFVATLLRRKN